MSYERSGLSENKEKLAELTQAGADQAEPKLAVRDPYIFEFLGIKPREVMRESDLEDALMKVKSDRAFTQEQEKWLALIRMHLIENLLLEKADFDYLPIFAREGASWGKLNRVFEGNLETIISEINQAVAA